MVAGDRRGEGVGAMRRIGSLTELDFNGWWLVAATLCGAGIWALLILALVKL